MADVGFIGTQIDTHDTAWEYRTYIRPFHADTLTTHPCREPSFAEVIKGQSNYGKMLVKRSKDVREPDICASYAVV
jgi:hypothetical protein